LKPGASHAKVLRRGCGFVAYMSPWSITTIRSTFAFSSVTLHFLVSVVTFLLIAHLGESGNICYYPNGDTMGTDVPCDPDAPVTQCCGSRSACLTNGLCVLEAADDTGISYARGTCTDRSWSSPYCPQQCQLNQDTPTNSSAYDFRAGGVQVWQCGTEGYAQEAQFCCESDAEKQRCCETEAAVFSLDSATLGPSTAAAITTLSFTSSAASTRLMPTASPTQSETRAPYTPTAIPPVSGRTDSLSNNNATTIGASVGGAVGGCILVAMLILFIRRHKRRTLPHVSEPHSAAAESEYKPHYEPRHELAAEGPRPELASHDQPVWELPAVRQSPGPSAGIERR
jgi:hypothetical protein